MCCALPVYKLDTKNCVAHQMNFRPTNQGHKRYRGPHRQEFEFLIRFAKRLCLGSIPVCYANWSEYRGGDGFCGSERWKGRVPIKALKIMSASCQNGMQPVDCHAYLRVESCMDRVTQVPVRMSEVWWPPRTCTRTTDLDVVRVKIVVHEHGTIQNERAQARWKLPVLNFNKMS